MAAVPREKVAPPFPDEALRSVDPRTLPRDQMVWGIGRAATLGIADEKLWRRFGESISVIGEAHLSPSEVCRLLQAFAYAPQEAPLDDRQLQRLLRAFARNVREYNDERLMRLIYGYGKLAAKRRLGTQKFLDFAASEVVERARTLRGWRKIRILLAVWHLNGASSDFRNVLVGQVMQHVSSLDSTAFRNFVPMVLELNFHLRPGVVDKLNTAYKRKLYGWQKPELLLRSGLDMVLHDLMKTGTLSAWLLRLHELNVPICPVDRNDALQPTLAVGCGPYFAGAAITGGRSDAAAQSHASDAHPTCNAEGGEHSSADCPGATATENLQALKMVEMCLRHERPSHLTTLPPPVQHLLARVRSQPLQPPANYQLLELPFVYAGLRRLVKSTGCMLHPTIYGPYLLELADPLGRIALEWDTAWTLYPPYRWWQQEAFVRRKHFILQKEGWKVVCVPLASFQALQSRESKLDFMNRFFQKNDLGYLLMED